MRLFGHGGFPGVAISRRGVVPDGCNSCSVFKAMSIGSQHASFTFSKSLPQQDDDALFTARALTPAAFPSLARSIPFTRGNVAVCAAALGFCSFMVPSKSSGPCQTLGLQGESWFARVGLRFFSTPMCFRHPLRLREVRLHHRLCVGVNAAILQA